MGSTTAKGIPYPVATDTPDVPRDVKALADWLTAAPPWALAAGVANIAPVAVASQSNANVAITFPVGRFSQVPVLQVSIGSVIANTVPFIPRHGLITATGATLYVFNNSAGSLTPSAPIPMHWSAIQMTSAAGPGLLGAYASFVATCATDGCDNAGHAIELAYDPEDPPDGVVCGVCGQPITDLGGITL